MTRGGRQGGAVYLISPVMGARRGAAAVHDKPRLFKQQHVRRHEEQDGWRLFDEPSACQSAWSHGAPHLVTRCVCVRALHNSLCVCVSDTRQSVCECAIHSSPRSSVIAFNGARCADEGEAIHTERERQ